MVRLGLFCAEHEWLGNAGRRRQQNIFFDQPQAPVFLNAALV